LTAALEEKGVSVLRPDYAGVSTHDEEDVVEPEQGKRKKKQNLKQNFEETSDEDN
jgi:hypothetical protein